MGDDLTTIRRALDDIACIAFVFIALGAVWREYIPRSSRLWVVIWPATALCIASLALRFAALVL